MPTLPTPDEYGQGCKNCLHIGTLHRTTGVCTHRSCHCQQFRAMPPSCACTAANWCDFHKEMFKNVKGLPAGARV